MTLQRTLSNNGVIPHDAEILEQYYADADPGQFVDGLEEVAKALAFHRVERIALKCEPWKTIYDEFKRAGDPDEAYLAAVSLLDKGVQQAVIGAVTLRVRDIIKWDEDAQDQSKGKKTKEVRKALKRYGYRFSYDEVHNLIHCNGQPLDDNMHSTIVNSMADIGVSERRALHVYTQVAAENKFNPLRDYLLNLRFNGGDPLTELSTYFRDRHGLFRTWLQRWMIGSVARVMGPNQNRMFVLEGKQEMGKDYFAKWLCSPMPEFFKEGRIEPDDKDHRVALATTWIWNVSELGSTVRRADREALKAFITLETVTDRKPYGRYPIRGKVITSFIGSINYESGLLSDPTGNRRYMIEHLDDINWDYATEMDPDQLWAQAVEMYMVGEPWRLSKDEVEKASEINESYEFVDIVLETIIKFYDVDPEKLDWFTPTTDVVGTLKDPGFGNLRSEANTIRVSAALTRLGIGKPVRQYIRGKQVRGYQGVRLSNEVPW